MDLVSSLLHDLNEYYNLGLDETKFIIDRYKIRRERNKSRNQTDSCFNDDKVWCLSFDERRDSTMIQYKDDETKNVTQQIFTRRAHNIIKRTRIYF